MDFISSISFPNEPLISWTFLGHFCHHFWVDAIAKQQKTHPKVMTKMVKKCLTDQRFIRKRNTTYKIHTLVRMIFWHHLWIAPSFSSGRKGDRTQGIMDTFGLPSLLQGLLVAICVFLGNYIKVLNLYYLVAVEFRLCSFLFLEWVKIKKI